MPSRSELILSAQSHSVKKFRSGKAHRLLRLRVGCLSTASRGNGRKLHELFVSTTSPCDWPRNDAPSMASTTSPIVISLAELARAAVQIESEAHAPRQQSYAHLPSLLASAERKRFPIPMKSMPSWHRFSPIMDTPVLVPLAIDSTR